MNQDKTSSRKPPPIRQDVRVYLARLARIFEGEYDRESDELVAIVRDVEALYRGEWPTHEVCQVEYHTIGHTLEVALASARMMAGWNRQHAESGRFSEEDYLTCLVAALFHDSGYIKDKGDKVGRGGKLAFVHVGRSKDMAAAYLAGKGWSRERIELVRGLIEQTEATLPVRFEGVTETYPGRELSSILATADLLAQMADVDYMERLPDLFAEFKEAYEHEGYDNLRARGIFIFRSAQEMIDGTTGFFENFVVPRFEKLGRMDRYLNVFFESSRNPYTESLVTNLYRTSAAEGIKPQRRLGEMLKEFGLVSEEAVNRALSEQKGWRGQTGASPNGGEKLRLDRLIEWIAKNSCKTLGEVLLDKGEISPTDLHWVVQERLLPSKMLEGLSFKDLVFLLRIGIMLNHIRHSPRVLSQALEALNDEIFCQASSIMLAEESSQTLIIVSAAGRQKADVETVSIPWDKGVAGWVFCQGRSAIVDNVNYDRRFFKEVDVKVGFSTRSILAVPLVMNGNVVGVVEAINKQKGAGLFDERDLYILNVFAQQVAGSMDTFFARFERG